MLSTDSQIKQQLSSLQYVKGLCESRLQQLSTGRASDMDIPVLVSVSMEQDTQMFLLTWLLHFVRQLDGTLHIVY